MAIKSLLPAIAGFIIKGVKTLLAIGNMGVCWADTFVPHTINAAIRDMFLMNDIYIFFTEHRDNVEFVVKFHQDGMI